MITLIWDIDTGKGLSALFGEHPLTALAVTPDGRRLVSASEPNNVTVWDLRGLDQNPSKPIKEESCAKVLKAHTGPVTAVAVTPDGRRAISGSLDQTVRLWDLQIGHEFDPLERHAKAVTAVAATPDSRRAISGSEDGTLKMWEVNTGRLLLTIHVGGEISAVAITPDGRKAVTSVKLGKQLKIWNLETGSELYSLEAHPKEVTAVVLTADGRQALSSSIDGTVKVWDLETRRAIRILKGSTKGVASNSWPYISAVQSLAVTADGRWAICGQEDHSVRVWDVETGSQRLLLKGHDRPVTAVALNPDGAFAVSGADLDFMGRLGQRRDDPKGRTLRGLGFGERTRTRHRTELLRTSYLGCHEPGSRLGFFNIKRSNFEAMESRNRRRSRKLHV